MSDQVRHVTGASFEDEVLKAEEPVLLAYLAPSWSRPSKMLSLLLDSIAAEYDGTVTVAKLDVDENVDENKDTPAKHSVRNAPTIQLFKDGNVVDTLVGPVGKSGVNAFLNKAVWSGQ